MDRLCSRWFCGVCLCLCMCVCVCARACMCVWVYSLLMSYIYGALSKARNFNAVWNGPRFGNADSRLFLFAAQCFNNESIESAFLSKSYV